MRVAGGHTLAVVVVAVIATLGAARVQAARVAVLAVPGDDPAAAAAAAATVKSSLPAGDTVVDDDALRLKLRGPAGAAVDVAVARAGVAAADEAFTALDHERSVSLLESAIAGLEADRDFSVEKRAVLEEARLTCAQRLLGLAGPSETGKAETKNGEGARRHLQNALKTNPGLTLPPGKYPPKIKTLFALAQGDVDKMGFGGLDVTSLPPGATVWVDGRAVGVTPLKDANLLRPGSWRLWLERSVSPSADGADRPTRRSAARVITVDKGAVVTVEIDVGFEGSFVAASGVSPALSPALSPLVPFTPAMLQRLVSLLDVDRLLLVGAGASVDGANDVWFIDVRPKQPQRTGHGDPASVTAWLKDPGSVERFVLDGGVPDSVFVASSSSSSTPGSSSSSASSSVVAEDGEFPWLGVGVGVGVAAVVVTGAVVAGVVYATRTIDSSIGFTVEPLP